MKSGFLIVIGLIVGVGLGFIIFKNTPPSPVPNPVVIIEDLPVIDTMWIPVIVYRDTTIYKDSIEIQIEYVDRILKVPIPVDTADIVKDYLTIKKFRIDTTAQDVQLSFISSIYANRVLTSKLTFSNNRECSTNMNGIQIGLIAGFEETSIMAGYSYNQFTYLGGYNFYNKGFKVGVLYKLKLNLF